MNAEESAGRVVEGVSEYSKSIVTVLCQMSAEERAEQAAEGVPE